MLVQEQAFDHQKPHAMQTIQQKPMPLQPDNECNEPDQVRVSKLGQYIREIADRITSHWYFTCEICLEQFDNHDCACYTACQHQRNFCAGCLAKYVKFKLMFFEEIRCPKDGCNAVMNIESSFFKSLPELVQKRYNKIRSCYQKLHDANFRTCPSESCDGNIIYNGNVFACTICKEKFCLSCLAKEHSGQCYMDEIAFFQNILHFRRCPKCKFIIEKNTGCDHITCVCKYEFCYKCNDTYTRTHRCEIGADGKISLKNPIVMRQPLKQNKFEQPEKAISKASLIETIFLGFSLIVVLIPLFGIFSVAFLLWISILGLIQIIKVVLVTICIMIVGAGPYAYQYSKGYQKWKIFMLSIGYPYSFIMGMYHGFKELFSYIVTPLMKRYNKAVKKCWKIVFIDSISE